jgi:hypothetical protein
MSRHTDLNLSKHELASSTQLTPIYLYRTADATTPILTIYVVVRREAAAQAQSGRRHCYPNSPAFRPSLTHVRTHQQREATLLLSAEQLTQFDRLAPGALLLHTASVCATRRCSLHPLLL